MPAESRFLPSRPSVRYLKLEAKRRLAAREFPALHDAQAAIAREHGLPSWAALKELIDSQPAGDGHALAGLRWVVARFRDADQPSWLAPDEAELRVHFDDVLLTAMPAPQLVAMLSGAAADLRQELRVIGQSPLQARAQLAGLDIVVTVAATPPYRMAGLFTSALASRITDSRAASPPSVAAGTVPDGIAEVAGQAFAELGLTGLAVAGGDPGEPPWVLVQGWADLDQDEALTPAHRFQTPGVSALAATAAVLQLVAAGQLSLDAPANSYLHEVRLADDTVTVRELLTHTGGVDSPVQLYADQVPDLGELMGSRIGCGQPRGTVLPSNGGFAVLGRLVEELTGSPYAQAVTRMVLRPLGLSSAALPTRVADLPPGAVTGYGVTSDGQYLAMLRQVCTVPAAGGLWSDPADVVRLGHGWATGLPAGLAADALRVQVPAGPEGLRVGLGWLISPRGDMAVHQGGSLDASAILHVRIRDGRAFTVLASRQAPIGALDEGVLRAWLSQPA
jgi:CubicO group peptidase (beta-lactamase class C family)